MARGYKYTVYLNGWVCQGDNYLFRIDVPEILNYIQARHWTFPNAKRKLDTLLDSYPDSFYDILKADERKRQDDAIQSLVEGLW